MKYNFYKQEFLCFDYRRGTIMAKTRKVDESDWEHILEEHRQKFIEETKNKYLLDCINCSEETAEDFEEFICEKMEKMDLEGGNRKGIGCPNCGE